MLWSINHRSSINSRIMRTNHNCIPNRSGTSHTSHSELGTEIAGLRVEVTMRRSLPCNETNDPIEHNNNRFHPRNK